MFLWLLRLCERLLYWLGQRVVQFQNAARKEVAVAIFGGRALAPLLQSGMFMRAMRTGARGSFLAHECCAFGCMYIGIQLVEPRLALRTDGCHNRRSSSSFCNWSGHPLSLSHVHCNLRSVRAPAVLHLIV